MAKKKDFSREETLKQISIQLIKVGDGIASELKFKMQFKRWKRNAVYYLI